MFLVLSFPIIVTTVDFSLGLLCLALLAASLSLFQLRYVLALPLFNGSDKIYLEVGGES